MKIIISLIILILPLLLLWSLIEYLYYIYKTEKLSKLFSIPIDNIVNKYKFIIDSSFLEDKILYSNINSKKITISGIIKLKKKTKYLKDNYLFYIFLNLFYNNNLKNNLIKITDIDSIEVNSLYFALVINLIIKSLKENRNYKGLKNLIDMLIDHFGPNETKYIIELGKDIFEELDKYNVIQKNKEKEKEKVKEEIFEEIIKDNKIKNLDNIYKAIKLYEQVNKIMKNIEGLKNKKIM